MTDDELDGLAHLVKPLVWADHSDKDALVQSRADSLLGTYFICDDTDDFTGLYLELVSHDDARWWTHVRATCTTLFEHYHDDDLTPLKAAAQADYTRRILSALNLDVLRSPPADAGPWRTVERLPVKPRLRSYEHVPCLIYARGEWEIGMWNCEHLVWDDAEGDDFRYHPTEPTHWMFLPAPPRALAETTKGDE